MYQGGKRISGYRKRRQHKERMKQQYGRMGGGPYNYDGYKSWQDYKANHSEYEDLDYWRRYYLSSSKSAAKKYTNKRIRAQRIYNDDSISLKHAEYRKEFDYGWWVW